MCFRTTPRNRPSSSAFRKSLKRFGCDVECPQNLTYKIESETLTVNWAAVSGAAGYRISIGVQSGDYDATYDLGPVVQMGPIDISDVAHDTYTPRSRRTTR